MRQEETGFNDTWVTVWGYYEGFQVKKAMPKDATTEQIIAQIHEWKDAGFKPSWNTETNKVQEKEADPIMKATEGQGEKKYVCQECGAEAEYKTGISKKNGKPWKAIFCKENEAHTKWLH